MTYEQERARLEQITPKSLPSNTAESGLSADQIQEKFWKGIFYLHELLEQARQAYASADVTLQQAINTLSATVNAIISNVTELEESSAILNFDDLVEQVEAMEAIVASNGDSINTIASQIAIVTASITTLRSEILNGAVSAYKAVRDGNGNVISTTYATKSEIAGVTSDVAGLKSGDVIASKASKDDDGNIIKNIYTKKSQIVDNVTDTSTDKPLSANQGKVLKGLIDGITLLLQSNDVDLDTVQEIVAYIKSNKTLIDSITTSKVSVSDIIDNLTSAIESKPLSAKQGYVLKGLIDGLVPNTRKIAGVDLLDDVTSSELKTALGIDNVNNTSDVNKPISTAQQTALDLKADKVVLTNSVSNGDFSNGTTGYGVYNATYTSVTNNILSLVKDIGISPDADVGIYKDILANVNDKIYYNIQKKGLVNGFDFVLRYSDYQANTNFLTISTLFSNGVEQSTFNILSGIFTNQKTNLRIQVFGYVPSTRSINIQLNYMNFINLTKIFGAGNEPTTEQMDAIMTLKCGYFSTATLNVIDVLKLFAPKTQEAWLTPTLTNSWTNVSGATVQYRKNAFGVVEFKGRMTGGANGSVAFTLPAGYYPNYPTSQLVTQNSDTAFARISNSGAGGSIVVSFTSTLTGWVDLSSITLKV